MITYLVRAGGDGPIKIGTTTNFQRRLGSLQNGCADRLIVLALLDGGSDVEARLHQRFGHLRIRGEWFDPAESLLAFARSPDLKKFEPEKKVKYPKVGLGNYLNARGLTMAEFAQLIGVTAQAVHRYIRGERFPRPAIMQRIKVVTAGDVSEADFYADDVGSAAA